MNTHTSIMDNASLHSLADARILHTMLRVSNLDRSLAFYTEILGMQLFRREEYPQGRFTLAFIGYGNEQNDHALELTYNWDCESYERGTAYGHIALAVTDITALCKQLELDGVTITRPPGPMKWRSPNRNLAESIAFIEDPDGYKVELIEYARQIAD